MRENFISGSIPFRKSYLIALVGCIEVDGDRIRIKGSKELLEGGDHQPSGKRARFADAC